MPYIFETFKQLHETFCCKRKLLNDSINGKLTLHKRIIIDNEIHCSDGYIDRKILVAQIDEVIFI